MTKSNFWIVFTIVLLIFGLTTFTPSVLADGDTWWHVKAGQWILAHGRVPEADPFTLNPPGLPWTAHEWLSEVLLALAFRLAGWSGVVILTGLAVAMGFAFLGLRLARDLRGLALLCTLIIAAALTAGGLLARPHMLALPVLVAWTIGLLRARDAGRAPSPWLLLLMVLWANLHGGYAFGIALVGPFALEALMEAKPVERWRVVRDWGLFGIAAVAVSVVTPHGLEGLWFPFKLISMKSIVLIGEWKPANFATLSPLEIAILGLVFVAFRHPVKVPVVRVLLLMGLLHMALVHGRHELLLGLVGSLVLAAPLGRAMGSCATPRLRAGMPAAAALLLGLAVLGGIRLALPVMRVDGPVSPISAMAAVPEELRRKPVVNAYAFGGYLIWLGVQPSIDGRADMYGDDRMFAHHTMITTDFVALDATIERSQIQWTIFSPAEPIVRHLDGKTGWRRRYADGVAVVHERVPGG